jgi:hypothetical protein
MFFLFVGGVAPRAVKTRLPGALCPSCRASGAVRETRVDQVLSLFFVPLFTLKRGARAGLACEACGWSSSSSSSSSPEAPPPPLPPPPPTQRPPPPESSGRTACPRCGTLIAAGWAYCPSCGAKAV